MFIRVYTCIQRYAYVCTQMCICVLKDMCSYVCTRKCGCVFKDVHMCIENVYMCVLKDVHMCVEKCVYLYMFVHHRREQNKCIACINLSVLDCNMGTIFKDDKQEAY